MRSTRPGTAHSANRHHFINIIKKCLLASIAPPGYMVRDSRCHRSCNPCHSESQSKRKIGLDSGDTLLIYHLWAWFFCFSSLSSKRSSRSMKASSPIGLPVRSCFLKSAISDSWVSTDKNLFQGDFIIAGKGKECAKPGYRFW